MKKYCTDKYGLTIHLAQRYYPFLLKYEKPEVISLAKTMGFLLCGRVELQEGSRFIQRHLYRIAKECGWYRPKKEGKLQPWRRRELPEQELPL